MKKYIAITVVAVLPLCSALASVKKESSNKMSDEIVVYNVIKGDFEKVKKVDKTEQEWKKILTPEQFTVTRKAGTERPFTGNLLYNKEEGVYVCACCGNHLFDSKTKYDSKTGWPSFYEPVAEENIGDETDNSFFMKRTEVHCARCGCHLGHVFDDGPPPTGKRFCINSAALKFQSIQKTND